MEINFKSYGEGKPVVILHGLLGSLDNWVSISKSLSENFKIIILDLPDHGKSSHTSKFSYKRIAEQLHFFFERNSLKNISIIGHSMGGMLASRFSLMYEDITSNLILINPIGLENYLEYVEYKDINFFYEKELKLKPENIINYQKKNY